MKKKYSFLLTLLCVASFSLSSCDAGVSTLLFEAGEITSIEIPGYIAYSAKFNEVNSRVKDFSYKIASALPYSTEDNIAFSPLSAYISLFSILGMSEEGSATYNEIIEALGLVDSLSSESNITYLDDEDTDIEEDTDVDIDEDSEDTSEDEDTSEEYVFTMLDDYAFLLDHTYFTIRGGSQRVTDALEVSSDLYIDESLSYSNEVLSSLASDYFISSYATDFTSESASKEIYSNVRSFTHKNSNSKYTYSEDTDLALLTSLYVTANWTVDGGNLRYEKKHEFTSGDGLTSKAKYLNASYNLGRVVTTSTYSTFYTNTSDNHFYLKFIVPNDGYTISDIYNEDTLKEANSLSMDKYAEDGYNAVDATKYENYYTRVLFPEFSVSYDADITSAFEEIGVQSAFKENNPDLSVTKEEATLEGIHQTNSFTLDKKGLDGYGSVSYELKWIDDSYTGYTDIYYDFIIDRAFIYILTDENNIPIYIGYVNNI